jgi:hypothetical protein
VTTADEAFEASVALDSAADAHQRCGAGSGAGVRLAADPLMSSAVSLNLVLYGLMAPFAAALMAPKGKAWTNQLG